MDKILLIVFGLSWVLAGCNAEQLPLVASPTIVPIFQLATPQSSQPTPISTQVAAAVEPILTPTAILYREITIYDEALDANWSLEQSQNLTFDLLDTSHWFEELEPESDLDVGAVSLAITPQKAWGALYFTLRANVPVTYLREEVQGLSFWVNSGDDYLSNDALVVTIVGSNEYPYWMAEDSSALTEVGYFPEIPLYDLKINDSIPPNTWVKVVLSMDQLMFGPEYRHVTGLYIKNKTFYRNTFYIDKLALLLAPVE